jgi:hypothetical protein
MPKDKSSLSPDALNSSSDSVSRSTIQLRYEQLVRLYNQFRALNMVAHLLRVVGASE